MRKHNREVTDINQIEQILTEAKVCRLALLDNDYPYIVPMCFGFNLDGDKLALYFHSAPSGKKLELIKKNNNVGFEIDCLKEIIKGDIACSFSASYQSITGIGTIDIINGIEKITGLNCIMKKYDSSTGEHKYSEQSLNNVTILKLTAEEFCCKVHSGQTE